MSPVALAFPGARCICMRPARASRHDSASLELRNRLDGRRRRGDRSYLVGVLALPMPLGSTVALFIPTTFAGPGGIPLIGTFPIPASPAILANEAVGAARKIRSVRAT